MQGKQGGQEGQGRLQYYLETILGNLQISVTNVHIRYEVPPPSLVLFTVPLWCLPAGQLLLSSWVASWS